MAEQIPPNPLKTPTSRTPRIIRLLSIFAILLALLILAVPWIVAHTGLRDPVINAILARPNLTASSERASFGWFSPLSIHELHLSSTNHHVEVRLEDITAERSAFQLWLSASDLGTITLDKPHVQLELPLDVTAQRPNRLEPTFTAVVKDAALTVRMPELDEPVIDVDGVNLTIRVQKTEEGRLLTLDPTMLFNRRKLTPHLSDKLLDLIDPTLGETLQASGEVSLSLEKLNIPIGIPRDQLAQRVQVEGRLRLHQVATEVRNPMQQALVQLVADMNGKKPSNVIRLIEDAEIPFQMRDGRLHHQGLRIGFPDIDPELQVTSYGSVGLDRTLDLHLELPRLDKALQKAKGPVQCHVTGTISNPKLSVQDASLVIRQPDRTDSLFAVDGIDLTMQVENTAAGRVLAVEPVEIFKKEQVGPGLAGGFLQLLEPDLRSSRPLKGALSLSFQKLRLPLGVASDQMVQGLEVEGKVGLHEVSTTVTNPLWQAVLRLVADMNGKKPSKVIRLVGDAEINFQMRDGRLHYDGLRIGFPDIDPELVVSARGSLGLNETLDLAVNLPRLRKDKRREQGPVQCHVTGTISNPRLSVRGGSLVVQLADSDQPMLALDRVDLRLSVENSEDGRMLTLAPVTIFEKQKLTAARGDQLLHLVAPTLGDVTRVQGEISLSLDTLRVPLGGPMSELAKRVELAGKLHLHEISASIKEPILQTLIKLLADMHGKKPSEVVRVVEDAEIRFQLRGGRINHEGLRIGLPDIAPDLVVSSRGSVGLDHSLDLELEVPRIPVKGRNDPLVTRGAASVRLHVTGTIEKPTVTEIKAEKDK
jgi:hypothetical protein